MNQLKMIAKIELMFINFNESSLSKIIKDLPVDYYKIMSFPNAESMFVHVIQGKSMQEFYCQCVILKPKLDNMSGIEFQKNLRKLNPNLISIFYSDAPTVECVSQAWRSGADYYFINSFDGFELHDVIKKIIKIKSININNYGDNYFNKLSDSIGKILTKREYQIMRFIIDGKKNEEICAELFISLATVKMHRANLMRKLNVKNAVQLANLFHKKIFFN